MDPLDSLILFTAALVWLGVTYGVFRISGAGSDIPEGERGERKILAWFGGSMWLFWSGVAFLLAGARGVIFLVVLLVSFAFIGALAMTLIPTRRNRAAAAQHSFSARFLQNMRRLFLEMPIRLLDGL